MTKITVHAVVYNIDYNNKLKYNVAFFTHIDKQSQANNINLVTSQNWAD